MKNKWLHNKRTPHKPFVNNEGEKMESLNEQDWKLTHELQQEHPFVQHVKSVFPNCQVRVSPEALQDIEVRRAILQRMGENPLSEEEIEQYRKMHLALEEHPKKINISPLYKAMASKPLDPDEAADWDRMWEKIKTMDIDALRKKVRFERDVFNDWELKDVVDLETETRDR